MEVKFKPFLNGLETMKFFTVYPTAYWDSATIDSNQDLLISSRFTTSPDGLVGGWVGAGLMEIKTNSAFKLSLTCSWG